ncbi:MAG: hypothetical protein ACKVWR_11650 [Acidimicrobiales bacterium]
MIRRAAAAALAAMCLAACAGGDDPEPAAASAPGPAAAPSAPAASAAEPPVAPTPSTSAAAFVPARAPSAKASAFAPADADPLVESLATRLLAGQASAPLELALAPAEARCVSKGLLSGLGLEKLVRAGLAAEGGPGRLAGLSTEDRGRFAEAFLRCIDLGVIVTAEYTRQLALAPETSACLVRELDGGGALEGLFRASVQAAADGPPDTSPLLPAFQAAAAACLSPEELAALGS